MDYDFLPSFSKILAGGGVWQKKWKRENSPRISGVRIGNDALTKSTLHNRDGILGSKSKVLCR